MKKTVLILIALILGGIHLIQAQNCQASFTANVDPNGVAVFTSTSVAPGGVSSWSWTFGNNQTGSGPIVTMPYANSGIYQVCLIITNSDLTCIDTVCQNVTVNIQGQCNMNVLVSVDSTNSIAVATVTGGTPPYTYSWYNGGNGSTTILSQSVPDNYCVYVTDAAGCADSACVWYTPSYICNTGFTYNIGQSGQVTLISGAFSNLLHTWNFGDGTSPYSTYSNQTVHTYPPGTYNVCLNLQGCPAYCMPITVTTGNPCNMISAITADTANNTLSCVTTLGTPPYTYLWSNGATTQSITTQSPGFYCVQVTDALGCIDSACFNYLPQPNCNYGFTFTYGASGMVYFVTSGAFNQNINWDFGDGSPVYSSINQTVPHTFSAPGTYTVCAWVTGCAPVCQTVNVTSAGCNLAAVITTDSTNTNLFVTAYQGTAPYTYLWSTGSTQQAIYPTTAGNYCVTVTDANGCSTNVCQNFTPNPTCNFTFTWSSVPNSGVTTFYSTNSNQLLVTWNFGDGTVITSTSQSVTHTYSTTGSYQVCATPVGCPTSCYNIYAYGLPSAVICGMVFNDANGNALIDSAETGIGGAYLQFYGSGFQTSILSDSITGNFSFFIPPGTYTINMCGGPALVGGVVTVPGASGTAPPSSCYSYVITINAGDTLCGFNFGILYNTSTVSGKLFFDSNSNGTFDSGEFGISNQAIQVGPYTTYTNSQGNYSVLVPIGNYNITYTPAGAFSSGVVTNPGLNVSVTAAGTTYPNRNIGLYLPPGQTDLSVTIHPSTTVTPGFPAWYSIYVCNNGPTPTAANLTMQYDAVLTPISQNPTASSVNTSTQTLTWNLPVINPGSCSYVWVNFNAAVGIPLGGNTFELAAVVPTNGIDNNLSNNTDTIHQIVVGSWDPNNKVVDYTNIPNSPDYQMESGVNPDQEIRYTVNFQNTGTAPAYNVVVEDAISSNLNIGTYQFVGSSHNCLILGSGYQRTYKFLNIMLPDSNSNEPASHGSLSYKIQAIPGLLPGEQILDHAEIYFDFNAPIITNDALVTIVGLTSNQSPVKTSTQVYPNPANDLINASLFIKQAGPVTIQMMDISGKVVLEKLVNLYEGNQLIQLELEGYSEGLYLIQVKTNDGILLADKINIKK